MKVSVIIPTYNSAQYIRKAVQSVFDQTYKDYEVIVVDDGSTDNTREIIKQYEGRIKYFFQENKGSALARNQAIKLSQGELIAFLDSDDTWLPHKLKTQMNYLSEHPDVALIHSNISFMQDNQLISFKKAIAERHKGFSIFGELYLGNFITTSTVVLSRDCLNSVGLFDEDLRQGQDYDLWLRIAAKFRIGYQDIITTIYRIHDKNISKNAIRGKAHDLAILKKINSMCPELVNGIDIKKREKRHFDINYSLGYRYFCQYDLNNARKYFLKALHYNRFAIRPYIYIASSFWSKGTIDKIRSLKRKVISSIDVTPTDIDKN